MRGSGEGGRRRRGESERSEKSSLREKFADAVDISKDQILGMPLISMIGDREMTIENYIGILEYSDTVMRIKCKAVALRIDGNNLEIRTMTREFLYITGRIKCFSYEC